MLRSDSMQPTLSRPSLVQVLLVLFFVLAALPAGTVGILLTQRAWQRELHKVQEQHVQLAHHLAEALERYARDVDAVFQMVAMHMVSDTSLQALTVLLDRLHFKHICLVDDAGRIKRWLSPHIEHNIEHVPTHILAAIQEAGSGSVLPDHEGNPTIFLYQPMQNGDIALGALRPDYFIELQSVIDFGQAGHAAIVDRHGRIIAHPNPDWRRAMKDIATVEPVRRMMAGETGVTQFYSPATQGMMIAGFTTAPKMGWGVMIPQPLAELKGYVMRSQGTVWLILGVAVVSATLLGWLVSRWLAAPLHRIGEAAFRFSQGHFEARVPGLNRWCVREAALLAMQFNTMADDVNRNWQARQESEQRFREFAHIAADRFWETDMQQIFTYISPPPSGTRYLSQQAILGRHRRDLVVGDPEGKTTHRLQAIMERGDSFHDVTFQVLNVDGHAIDIMISGQPIWDSNGVIAGYRGIMRDMTAWLQVEEELRQAKLADQHRQAQKMEAIGTLAGGIAHDFNNILGAIMGFTELALYDVSSDKGLLRSNLEEVRAASERARELVRHILTFSQKHENKPILVSLSLLIAESLKLLRASLPATITIQQHIQPDVGMILADPIQIQQVVMNLCVNAEHAMRHTGGTLQIALETVQLEEDMATHHPVLGLGPHVRLTVSDTGHGMSPDIMNRIFEPFFTTKDAGQGTGLGLAVVHGIVTSHKGAIQVQSAPGQGTTFTIYLPCSDQPIHRTNGVEAPLTYGQGAILFVDDEPALARAGRDMLERLGYQVAAYTSSLEALNAFRAAPMHFDLVITDQTMTQMTGAAMARALRLLRPDIPIILCTGFSYTIDAAQAEVEGIDAFLMKPLSIRDLGLAVQRVLERLSPKG